MTVKCSVVKVKSVLSVLAITSSWWLFFPLAKCKRTVPQAWPSLSDLLGPPRGLDLPHPKQGARQGQASSAKGGDRAHRVSAALRSTAECFQSALPADSSAEDGCTKTPSSCCRGLPKAPSAGVVPAASPLLFSLLTCAGSEEVDRMRERLLSSFGSPFGKAGSPFGKVFHSLSAWGHSDLWRSSISHHLIQASEKFLLFTSKAQSLWNWKVDIWKKWLWDTRGVNVNPSTPTCQMLFSFTAWKPHLSTSLFAYLLSTYVLWSLWSAENIPACGPKGKILLSNLYRWSLCWYFALPRGFPCIEGKRNIRAQIHQVYLKGKTCFVVLHIASLGKRGNAKWKMH